MRLEYMVKDIVAREQIYGGNYGEQCRHKASLEYILEYLIHKVAYQTGHSNYLGNDNIERNYQETDKKSHYGTANTHQQCRQHYSLVHNVCQNNGRGKQLYKKQHPERTRIERHIKERQVPVFYPKYEKQYGAESGKQQKSPHTLTVKNKKESQID